MLTTPKNKRNLQIYKRRLFMASRSNLRAQDWWVLTLRGIVSILFGIAAVFWPGLTLVTLVYLFSAYILIMGIFGIVHSLGSIGHRTLWILSLLLAILQVAVGVYLVRHLQVGYATLVLLVGFIFIVQGVLEGVAAFGENLSAGHRTLLVIGAILSLLVGITVLAYPVRTSLAFVWVIGLYALISGPLMIAMSVDVKREMEI
jgi:uncharacterized membrane protein HdeD (DUF308 family)